MSFYITLPSNSSATDFPKNTKTKFTTKLKNAIKLEGSYEVALVGLMYPVSWKYRNDGDIKLSALNYKEISIKLEFFVYDSLQTVCMRLQEQFNLSPFGVVIDFNKEANRIFLAVPVGVTLNFTNGIEKDFGFRMKTIKGDKNIVKGEVVKPFLNDIDVLYIYSDIVEYQIVGDTIAPLLQIVASTNTKTDSFIDKIYDSPHYIPVSRNNIESIEIDIRSDKGLPINFTSGRVVVKLSFRKKNLYQ